MKKVTLSLTVLICVMIICSVVAYASTPIGKNFAKYRKQKVVVPQLTVGLPREGQTVIGNAITVQVTSPTTKIKQSDKKNRDQEGFLKVQIDDDKSSDQHLTTFRVNIARLSEGSHVSNVELVQNDGTSFTPPVKKTINFGVTRSAVKGGNQPKEPKIVHPGRLYSDVRI